MLGGFDLRLLGLGIGSLHVHLLLGDSLRALQRLPASCGNLGQLVAGQCHVVVGLGSGVLGVQPGVSISASTSPAFTRAPKSLYHILT